MGEKDWFFVKIRNLSSFPVNIDAVGFTVNERFLHSRFFLFPFSENKELPQRLEARSSLMMKFAEVDTTRPNDLIEIDGVYVETGCGHTTMKKDDLFHRWHITAGIGPINQ
jgi:hypothetical protein